MTLPQGLAFAIVIVMMALFVWGRLRYDLVAAVALLAAVIVGIVPAEPGLQRLQRRYRHHRRQRAGGQRGGGALRRDRAGRALDRPYLATINRQIVALVGSVTLLSAFVKNIGALAMLMPIAFQLARRTGTSPSSLLMPMSFGALLGGIVTLVGTSPNIIVSRVREQLLGQPFDMFDFTPVGAGIAVAGFVFLVFGWRLLPRDRKGAASMDAAFNLEGYTTEVTVPEDLPAAGVTVKALEDLGEGEIEVITLHPRRQPPLRARRQRGDQAGDILILQGEPAALERIVALEKLELTREGKSHEIDTPSDEIGVMEAVVTPDSPLVGSSVGQLKLFDRHAVNLLAVSRRGRRITHRLRAVKLRAGDVVVLRGNLAAMPETLGELHCLPLAERDLRIGRKASLVPIAVLAAAMALVAFNVVPVAVAFFGAAVVLLLAASLSAARGLRRHRMADPDHARRADPGQRCAAHHRRHRSDRGWLSHAAATLPPMGALALMLAAAMAVTPFLNNAATVLVMAPIAASFAGRLGYNPDAVPDGGGDRRGVRLPHADRASVQHAGDGAGRLSLRRLLAARAAAVADRARASACR